MSLSPPVITFTPTVRSNFKYDTFREKLLRRNEVADLASICHICSYYIPVEFLRAARLIPLSGKLFLENEYVRVKGNGLALSVNDADNGLLLCANCHGFLNTNDKLISIDFTGKIGVSQKLDKNNTYKSLRGKYVCWKEYIDERGWPTKKQLIFAFDYKNRKRKDMIDDIMDEIEKEADDEGEDAPVVKGPAIKKRRRCH